LDKEDTFRVKSGEENKGTESTYSRVECVTSWYRIRLGNRANLWHIVLFQPIYTRRTVRKVKVKCTLVQALRLCTGRTVHRGSSGIALLFLDHSTRRGEGSASFPGRSLPPGKTRYLLYRRLGGPQGRAGQVRKISPPPGFDPRTVQPVSSRYTD